MSDEILASSQSDSSAQALKGKEVIVAVCGGIAAYKVADVVSKLNAEVVRIVRAPDMQERIIGQGMEPMGNTPVRWTLTFQSQTPGRR